MNTPAPTNTCRQCGGPMASNAPEGLCARCLLSVALKEPEPADTEGLTQRHEGTKSSEGVGDPETPGAAGVDAGAGPAASPGPADFPDIADAADVARRLPQFEIMELLGRGGMGVVYKARQLNLDRIIALKILPPGDALTPDFVERFRREARSLAKLSHPNIVNVHDFGESGGLYYFVMEFVDGVNLRDMIRAGKMKPEEALAVVPKICDALQFAHEEGVVHRDIKPENILIDKRGRVKIADFGLAKLLRREPADHTLTMSGMTLGTPRYMAPEQLDKPETVDHRADIYSLGVVFYEMLTGEVPMGRFAPPSEKVRIDVRLDEIVLHALERDVERRYQHASEMRAEVEIVSSTPTPAPPPQTSAVKRWPAWVWWTLLVWLAFYIPYLAEWNRKQEMLGHIWNSDGQDLPVLLTLGAIAVMKLLELRSAKAAEPFSHAWTGIIVALFGACIVAVGPFPHVEWLGETLRTEPQNVASAAGATFELTGFSQTYVKHGYEFWQGRVIAVVSLLAGAFLLFAPRRPRWNVVRAFIVLLAGVAIVAIVELPDTPLKNRGNFSARSHTMSEVGELAKTDPAFRQFRDDFKRHLEVEAANHNTVLEQLFVAGKIRAQDYPLFGETWSTYKPAYGSMVCDCAALSLILIGVTRVWQTLDSSSMELAGVAGFFRRVETWSCLLLLVPCLLSVRAPWVEDVAWIPDISVKIHMHPDDFPLPGLPYWMGPWVESSRFSQAGSEFWQGRVLAGACVAAILVFLAVALKLCQPGVRAAALSVAGVVSIASMISFFGGRLPWKQISWHDFHAVAQHGAAAAESAETRRLLAERPHFVGQLAELERNVQALIAALTAPEVPPTAKNDDEFRAQLLTLGPGQSISQKIDNTIGEGIMTETRSTDGRTISPSFSPIIPTKTKLAQARSLAQGGVVNFLEESHQALPLLFGLGLLLLGIRDGYRCWRSRRERGTAAWRAANEF